MLTHRSSLLRLVTGLLFLGMTACGGGTYGTGGDSEGRTLVFTASSGQGVPNLRIRVAGVDKEAFSGADGSAEVALNRALDVQVVRVEFTDGTTTDLYLRTSALPTEGIAPIVLDEVGESVTLPLSGPDCEEIVTSWVVGAGDPGSGIPASALPLIEDAAAGGSCEDQLTGIADAVFEVSESQADEQGA